MNQVLDRLNIKLNILYKIKYPLLDCFVTWNYIFQVYKIKIINLLSYSLKIIKLLIIKIVWLVWINFTQYNGSGTKGSKSGAALPTSSYTIFMYKSIIILWSTNFY